MTELDQVFNRVVVKTSNRSTSVIDLTQDTVASSNLYAGYTAHDSSGEQIVGKVAPGSGSAVVDDDTIKINDDGELYVNTAKTMEEGNTLPITSAAVYEVVGNINELLSLI